MGLEIPALEIGALVRHPDDGRKQDEPRKVVRIFSDAVVLEGPGGRLYVPATEFDRWEVVSRPRYTLVDEGYL